MRKDVLLKFEYFPFIGSLYNEKLSPAPFEFQFFGRVSGRASRSIMEQNDL